MKIHKLKAWPSYFEAVSDGLKPFEVRHNDPDYEVGDVLILEEWDPTPDIYQPRGYTGRRIERVVTYVMHGGKFGIAEHVVVMALLFANCSTRGTY